MVDLNDQNAVAQAIKEVIAAEGMIDIERITPEATLENLNLQSIDVVMILSGIEDRFGVYIPVDGDLAQARDVKSFIDGVARYIAESKAGQA
jgi:acyl carrier protein